jgi:eukaryotic-like serine/threonine-protein kinase
MNAGDNRDPLFDVAGSISDGEAVDWPELRRRVAATDSTVLEELQILDGIAHVHRTEWGALEIIEPIGHGSFGTVYRAFDRDLLRAVALKVTRPQGDGVPFDPERLVREARRLARIKHPNVVAVFSAERKGNEVAVAMEWIKGQTLDALVQASGPLGAREVALIGIDTCRALAAVHAAGLLHGDIKAHNVMREEGGRIVLMDFGASRDLAGTPRGADDFAGTPLYIAPEVFAGAPRSTASDVYSLGVLLYYLATGTYPIDGDTRTAIDRQHAQAMARRHLRDARPDLPDGFVYAVQRAIAEDPAARYPSAGAFEAALASVLGGETAERRRPARYARLAMAAGIAAIAIAGAVVATRNAGSTSRAEVPATRTADASTASTPATLVPYDVEAGFYRVAERGATRLAVGETVRPGDRLYLEVKTSLPTHVYVVNQDETGLSYRLFPLTGYSEKNPIAAGHVHRLPGTRDGEDHYWQVSTPGGTDYFMVFVSPTPLTAFENTFAGMPEASIDAPVAFVPITANALNTLRGVGGVVPAATPRIDQPLYEQFRDPLPTKPETTRGTWVRRLAVTSTP